MTDELIPAEGISRRDMLKRSAVVGGASAMVWAAPSLTTFSARALGSTGTELTGWSYVAFIVVCGGQDYRAKWNRDGTDAGFEQGTNLPGNCPSDFVTRYEAAWTGGDFTVNEPTQSGSLLTFTITSDSCLIANGIEAGIAKEGATQCKYAGTVSEDQKSITFDVSIFD
jgi:hypothetical protein